MTDELNDFQRACEEDLARAGVHLTNRRVEGTRERFVVAEVPAAGLTVYLYVDEAGFDRAGTWWIFEKPDFDSPGALRSAFVEAVSRATPAGRRAT